MIARGFRMREIAACAALAVLLGAGCAGVPATHYYVLQVRPESASGPRGAEGLTLGVRDFDVDPPYDQDRIVYRVAERPSEVGFYAYHRWAAPLPGLLARAAAEALGGTAGVRTVEPVVAGKRYDALLDGRLLSLEEVDDAAGQQAVVRVELALRLDGDGEVWAGAYSASERLETREVGDVVERMGDAFARAVRSARADLARAVAAAAGEGAR